MMFAHAEIHLKMTGACMVSPKGGKRSMQRPTLVSFFSDQERGLETIELTLLPEM